MKTTTNYSIDYKGIFSYASALLAESIHEEAVFIEECRNDAYSVSWDYIKLTADNLCAYNEMFPYCHFVKSKSFLRY